MRLAGFAAIVGTAYGGTGLLRRLTEPDLEFEPITDLPGFRRVAGGPISGGSAALIGLGGGNRSIAFDDSRVCDALFGKVREKAEVQIAYFTDYRCVYCRQVSPMLKKLSGTANVRITWHDLPLLGEISVRSARAAIAARAQGAYGIFHERLMGNPVLPTPSVLRVLARDAGIDGERLLRDMISTRTDEQLAATSALALRFGFFGTPAVVVGRTAALGGIDRRLLDRLIAIEREAPQPGPCG